MTAFAEGVDVSAAHPRSVFGHDERTLSDWWYRQEYLCEFVQTNDTVFDYELIKSATDGSIQPLCSDASGMNAAQSDVGGELCSTLA
jgi:hypothetical protein